MNYKLLNSKYYKIYNQIIDNRISNPLSLGEYGENHHIIPKSCGGSNYNENIVRLTAREHYVCHYLLTKFTEGEQKSKMVYAFHMMNITDPSKENKRYFNSRLYESNKKLKSKEMSKFFSDIERTDKWKNNISLSHKGKVKSFSHIENIKNTRRIKKSGWKPIQIFDSNDNIVYEFDKVTDCIKYNISKTSVYNSLKRGVKFYEDIKYQRKQLEKKGRLHQVGWYAKYK